jgi:hypothetical protein
MGGRRLGRGAGGVAPVAPRDQLAQRAEVVPRPVGVDHHDQVLDARLDERVGVLEQVVVDAPRALDLRRVAPDRFSVTFSPLPPIRIGMSRSGSGLSWPRRDSARSPRAR